MPTGSVQNLVQAEREGADARPENERHRPGQAREQHRLDERAVQRHLEPFGALVHTSRPPE